MKPYIGITDFTRRSQVREMLSLFTAHRPPNSFYLLHVGVMMSYKTLNGLPTRWEGIFPANDRIAEIFSLDAYNCLHYADYEDELRGEGDLWRQLMVAMSYCGERLSAIQLDMPWPDPGSVSKAIRLSHRPIEVILQIGGRALEEVGNDPQRCCERLRAYEGTIHRVLLDRSMGRGIGMDAATLLPFARAIRDGLPDIGIGVAGGLGPNSLHLLEPLLSEFSGLSIDAQGQLRPSGNAIDPIDWEMAGSYLTQALSILH